MKCERPVNCYVQNITYKSIDLHYVHTGSNISSLFIYSMCSLAVSILDSTAVDLSSNLGSVSAF